ncbi:hypothetical protein [Pseudomonas moraviensis]|uniref:Uncharacterized protein n=1 Tax=Pseudomonas moraviensis R28-S TaxID=1395516 RepID=V8R6F3_9PSED|nr:hypothetical protein [Pseudomonas moraviensis]ETF06859.1 hypothetical protein PMO01_18595 [Pseudomonas moraviensis R28-S]
MKQYYDEKDYNELMGLSPQDVIDIATGKMKPEEEILPELLVNSKEEALELLRRFNEK